MSEKTNRGYYILLKKLNDEMNNTEYTIQKLNNFKILLNKKLEEILDKNDFTNEIIISLIFNVLKKSYYLMGKDKNKSNISINEQVGNDRIVRKNSSLPQFNVQESDNSDIEKNPSTINNNNGIYDGSVIEESLNLALRFLAIPKKIENNQNEKIEKIEKIEEEQKDKNGKIFFLLSKNNNTPKPLKKDENGNSRKDEISINCMNFIYKFLEEPLLYQNKFQEAKTVILLFFILKLRKFYFKDFFTKKYYRRMLIYMNICFKINSTMLFAKIYIH